MRILRHFELVSHLPAECARVYQGVVVTSQSPTLPVLTFTRLVDNEEALIAAFVKRANVTVIEKFFQVHVFDISLHANSRTSRSSTFDTVCPSRPTNFSSATLPVSFDGEAAPTPSTVSLKIRGWTRKSSRSWTPLRRLSDAAWERFSPAFQDSLPSLKQRMIVSYLRGKMSWKSVCWVVERNSQGHGTALLGKHCGIGGLGAGLACHYIYCRFHVFGHRRQANLLTAGLILQLDRQVLRSERRVR
jgi:hypothetical protein